MPSCLTAPVLDERFPLPGAAPVAPLEVTEGDRESLLTALGRVPDPRDPRGVRYPIVAMVTVVVCAMLAGARSYAAIGQWCADQQTPDGHRPRDLAGEPEVAPVGGVQVRAPLTDRGVGARSGEHRADHDRDHGDDRVSHPARVPRIGYPTQRREQRLAVTLGDLEWGDRGGAGKGETLVQDGRSEARWHGRHGPSRRFGCLTHP